MGIPPTTLVWTLIALAAIGSATPGLRRALHKIHVAEQRVGQERMRFWGAAQRAATPAAAPRLDRARFPD
jgi:hypothetical protein